MKSKLCCCCCGGCYVKIVGEKSASFQHNSWNYIALVSAWRTSTTTSLRSHFRIFNVSDNVFSFVWMYFEFQWAWPCWGLINREHASFDSSDQNLSPPNSYFIPTERKKTINFEKLTFHWMRHGKPIIFAEFKIRCTKRFSAERKKQLHQMHMQM